MRRDVVQVAVVDRHGRVCIVVAALLSGCSREPAPEPPAGDACERGCAAAAGCLLAPADCTARCRAEPAIRACVDVASDCSAAGRCFLAQTCGAHAPAGVGTCRSALDCMLACPDRDLACGCACTERADPRHTLALARVGTCVVDCDFAEPCIRARCAVTIQTCWLQ